MSLSNKYNVPEETIKKMVSDGILSTKWPMWETVCDLYKKIRNEHPDKSKESIYYDISEKTKVNDRTVKQIIHRMADKI